MKKLISISLLWLLSSAAIAQGIWPNNKRAAIVLTYDDGLKTQRDIVVPQLEKRGFHGTFFLYGQIVKTEDIPLWRNIAEHGHELGNHSLFHPCRSGTTESSNQPCRSLECYSIKEMLTEIEMMNSWLFAIDGKTVHSYAYPCGQSQTGDGDYAKPLIEKGITKYARGADVSPIVSNLPEVDFSKVPTFSVKAGLKSDKMIAAVKESIEKGTFCVFVFHGVGGDYLTVDAEEHQKLLDFIKENSDKIWVGTFFEVMDYLYNKIGKND